MQDTSNIKQAIQKYLQKNKRQKNDRENMVKSSLQNTTFRQKKNSERKMDNTKGKIEIQNNTLK